MMAVFLKNGNSNSSLTFLIVYTYQIVGKYRRVNHYRRINKPFQLTKFSVQLHCVLRGTIYLEMSGALAG